MTVLGSPRRFPPLLAAMLAVLAIAGCHFKSDAESAAEPIAEKNAAARGGLSAWRKVKTMSMSGNLDAGKPRDPVKLAMSYLRPKSELQAERKALASGRATEAAKQVQVPFVMELERPRKMRVEITFQGQTAVQVFDGSKGWKLRPFLGRREVEPFNAEEMRQAAQQTELDGLLIDHGAKGNRLELVGTEKLEGRDNYKLKVTTADGQVRHVWVDAETFLETRVEGSRRLDGKIRPVWTTFRDYRSVDGLMIPHVLETTVDGTNGAEQIRVERVVVNPKLGDARFAKPEVVGT